MNAQAAQVVYITNIVGVVSQFAGLAFALGIGLWPVRRERLTTYAVAAGILVNLPSFLGEGGPGLFAGLILFPVMFALAAHLGRGIRWILVRLGLVVPEPRSGDRI